MARALKIAAAVLVSIAVIGAAGFGWWWYRGGMPGAEGVPLPAHVASALRAADRFDLLALDPAPKKYYEFTGRTPPPGEDFHGYIALKRVTIADKEERQALLAVLDAGIRENRGMAAACFKPRHGISVATANGSIGLVICFECMQIKVHGAVSAEALTSGSPQKAFDAALARPRG